MTLDELGLAAVKLAEPALKWRMWREVDVFGWGIYVREKYIADTYISLGFIYDLGDLPLVGFKREVPKPLATRHEAVLAAEAALRDAILADPRVRTLLGAFGPTPDAELVALHAAASQRAKDAERATESANRRAERAEVRVGRLTDRAEQAEALAPTGNAGERLGAMISALDIPDVDKGTMLEWLARLNVGIGKVDRFVTEHVSGAQ